MGELKPGDTLLIGSIAWRFKEKAAPGTQWAGEFPYIFMNGEQERYLHETEVIALAAQGMLRTLLPAVVTINCSRRMPESVERILARGETV